MLRVYQDVFNPPVQLHLLWAQYCCMHSRVLTGCFCVMSDDGQLEGELQGRCWGERHQAVVTVQVPGPLTAYRERDEAQADSKQRVHASVTAEQEVQCVRILLTAVAD